MAYLDTSETLSLFDDVEEDDVLTLRLSVVGAMFVCFFTPCYHCVYSIKRNNAFK